MQLQLYIHFPFCKSKCLYCDFCSHKASPDEIARYCAALEKEIEATAQGFQNAEVTTVFLGGGTPSLVPAKAMDGVMRALKRHFAIRPDAEFTAEANPGTLQESWLDCLQSYGLNRLSLGVQAGQDRLLKALGRIHTLSEAVQAFQTARRSGIQNINLDLMYALPGQTLADWRETLQMATELAPEHISAYSLILEENTPLYTMAEAGQVRLPDDDFAADAYQLAGEILNRAGYRQYEISNYAYPGRECRHNIGYWQGEWYLGLGVNAHSMLPAQEEGFSWLRRFNTFDTKEYIRRVFESGSAVEESENISPGDAMFETVMVGLRMNRGVSDADFSRRFGLSLRQKWGAVLDTLVEDGLAKWDHGSFCLTSRGLLLQNEALLRMMKDSCEEC